MRANNVTIQHRHLATMLQQLHGQQVGGGGLAGATQAGEPDAGTLAVTRWPGVAQDLGHFRTGEPFRQRAAAPQILLAHLGAGNVRDLGIFLNAGDLLETSLARQVHQLAEGNDAYTEFLLTGLHQLLGVIGPVKGTPLRIVARAGVVASDDNVVGAEVAADDGVPQGPAWASHPHGQRQQGEQHPVGLEIAIDQRAIGAHAGVMVDVTGPRQPHDRMQQEHAVHFRNGAPGQFLVGAMQRIACLEGDDVVVAVLVQQTARFGRRATQEAKVLVRRCLQHLESAGKVERTPAVHFRDQGVARVQTAEDLQRGLLTVPGVDFLHRQDGQQVVLAVAQGDVLVKVEVNVCADRQGDGNGEEHAIGQAHRFQHAKVIRLAHEAIQWRETAGGQQLQIAERPFAQLDGGQRSGVGAGRFQLLRGNQQVDQGASPGGDETGSGVSHQVAGSSSREMRRDMYTSTMLKR